MFKVPKSAADVENTATWAKYSRRLCDHCSAVCCSLPVEVTPEDLGRMGVADPFELMDNPKKLAKRLCRDGVVEHFHSRTMLFTLARRPDGCCVFLDPASRRCTIYERRPNTCRNHPQIGPRAGYCAFHPRNSTQ